jgi:hypothetical protein
MKRAALNRVRLERKVSRRLLRQLICYGHDLLPTRTQEAEDYSSTASHSISSRKSGCGKAETTTVVRAG